MPPPYMPPAPAMQQPMQMAAAPDWRRQQLMAQMMMQGGGANQPVRHWAEGLGRLAQIAGGAYMMNKASKGEAAENASLEKVLMERGMKLPEGISLSNLPPEVRNSIIANVLDPAEQDLKQVWNPQTGQMEWISESQAAGMAAGVPFGLQQAADLQRAAAGRSSVNVNMPAGEGKFWEGLGKLDADTVTAARTAAQGGQGLLQTMGQLEALLDAGLRTGSLAGFERDVGSLLQAVGIDPEGVGLQDPGALGMVASMTVKQALALAKESTGSISNIEMQSFSSAAAGLEQTPEGNRLLIAATRDLVKRQMEYASALNDWVAQGMSPSAKGPNGKTFYQTWDEYTKTTPAISPEVMQAIKDYGPKQTQQQQVTPEAQPATASSPIPTNPQPGQIINGFRFKGGDPADQNSWEVVQ